MLFLDLKPGDSVKIGDIATVTLERKTGKAARIAFDANPDVQIRKVEASPSAIPAIRANPLHGILHVIGIGHS